MTWRRIEASLLAGPRVIPWMVVVAFGYLGLVIIGSTNPTGDTGALVAGAHQVHDCLTDTSQWGSCSGVPYSPVQFIPAIILINFVSQDWQIMSALAVLNGLAFAATLWMGWRMMASRGRDLAAFALLLILSGPLLAYAASTFGEMLAAFGFAAVVYSLARRAPVVAIAGAAWLATITKDTALPFVLIIAAVVIFNEARRPRWSEVRGRVLAIITGCAVGVITVIGLNLLRWGTPWNKVYSLEIYKTPTGRVPDTSAGLLFSPNGGLIIFWPVASALVIACIYFLIRAMRQERGDRLANAWAPAILLIGGIGLIVSLAAWWAPFGWSAWGPRLALPVMTGLAFASLYRFHAEIRAALQWSRRRIWPLALGGAIVLFSVLGNLGGLARPLIAVFQAPQSICPLVTFEAKTTGIYYDCLHYNMWYYGPVFTQAMGYLNDTPAVTALTVVMAAAIAVLCLLATNPGETYPVKADSES